MSVRIRDAVPRDAPVIAAVHQASRAAAYAGRVDEELLNDMDPGERRRRWVAWLADPAVATLVAEQGGEVVAFSTLRPSRDADADPGAVAELPTLYVRPDRWRRGLGSRLCRVACRRAASMGFQTLTLWVLDLNREARRFYESFGFHEDGATKMDDGPTLAPLLARRYRMELAEVDDGVRPRGPTAS
mgnify:CR=1 FL=1